MSDPQHWGVSGVQISDTTEPDYYYAYFNSARIPSKEAPDSTNRWRYRNPAVDAATDAGRRELDPVRRKEIYDQVQRLVATDVPVVALWHEDNIAVISKRLSGYTLAPNGRYSGLITTDKAPR